MGGKQVGETKNKRKDHRGEDAEMMMIMMIMMMMMTTTAAAMMMMIMKRKKMMEDIRMKESAIFFDLIVSFCVEWLRALFPAAQI